MTNDERSKKLRLDALGIAPPENMLSSQKRIRKKPQLSLQFMGGTSRLVLSADDKG